MKFEKKLLNNHEIEIIANADADQFAQSKVQAARLISRESKIAGFRPGKAPYDVVKRLYGEEAIEERAVDLLINQLYPDLIKEAEIKPYAAGKLEEILEKDPPKFRLSIPLEPEVTLADYKTIKFLYKLPGTGEKDVEAVLRKLQTNYATAEEVERKSDKGDLVSVRINATLTKPDKEQDSQILKDTPNQTILGESGDEEQFPFPGFEKHLAGLVKGESREFSHKYPKDSNYGSLRNKEVNFTITVESVKQLTKPQLDDEFAKTLGVDDLKTLKETITPQLETEQRNTYDNQYFNDLLDKLVQKSTIKYPPLALEEEIADVLKNFEQNLAGQNLDLDTYLKINTREKEDFLEKDITPAARKRLEHALVIDAISRAEEIKLDQKELQQEYTRSFMQMQSTADFSKIRKQLTTRKLSNALVMQAASRLMNQRTLDRIKAYANGEPIADTQEKSEVQVVKEAKPAKKPGKKTESASEIIVDIPGDDKPVDPSKKGTD